MSMGLRRPMNFQMLVRSLTERGISQRAIARQLHVAPSTVNRWLTDQREPRYHNGEGLLFLAGVAQRHR